MGGKSESRTSTTQIANDNRVFNDNRADNRQFTTIDDRDDNRVFNDNRQDNRQFTTIDDRDDNRTFIDDRDTIDNSVGAGAIVNSGAGNITITETDNGATEQAFAFAETALQSSIGAVGTLIEGQKASNAQLVDAIFKNSDGGQAENGQKLAYAGLFAGVSMIALFAFRKGI